MNRLRSIFGIVSVFSLFLIVPSAVGAVDIGSGGMQITRQSPTAQIGGSLEFTLQLPGVVADDDQIIVTVHEPLVSEAEFLRSVGGQGIDGVLASRVLDIADLDLSLIHI